MRQPQRLVILIGVFILLAAGVGFAVAFLNAANQPINLESAPHRMSAQTTLRISSVLPSRSDVQRMPPSKSPLSQLSSAKPVFHPRDPAEWQGMIVNLSAMAICDTSARCGLAMACHSGKCGPCTSDIECAINEICILDHCIQKKNADCRSYRDCNDAELCILSGYSSDPRGNAEMVARCQLTSGSGAEPETTEIVIGLPAPAPDVSGMELLEQARNALEATK